jgi:hypothetical protein
MSFSLFAGVLVYKTPVPITDIEKAKITIKSTEKILLTIISSILPIISNNRSHKKTVYLRISYPYKTTSV